MKNHIAIVVLGLMSVGLAQSAAAYSVSPLNTAYTATGPATIRTAAGSVINCTLTITGRTLSNGKAKTFTAAFSAGDAACVNTTASDLPWMSPVLNATTLKLEHFTVTTPDGTCGPIMIRPADNASGVWTVTNASVPPGCTFSATLATTPAITIVP
jgi:hypothetical protein